VHFSAARGFWAARRLDVSPLTAHRPGIALQNLSRSFVFLRFLPALLRAFDCRLASLGRQFAVNVARERVEVIANALDIDESSPGQLAFDAKVDAPNFSLLNEIVAGAAAQPKAPQIAQANPFDYSAFEHLYRHMHKVAQATMAAPDTVF
jgi:hypothetical protein